ncbi:transcriptional activator DEMETER-like [Iris pallida]|uniref:Transcriptional activator DEMETER-like n=1 Tax=Iris pallida TaxID=29817 RepID=A0AAX6EWF1_IRIPA|nr:transcriptional activator DEMETER-like [Iris pallida]
MDPINELVRRLSCLNINEGNKKVTVQEQNALDPYVGGVGAMVVFEGKKRKPRPKVDLDPESDRVWRLFMGREVEGDAEMGADKEKWWEEERRVFCGRAESFIARMHLVQEPGQNQSASDKIYDALLKGTKRNRILVDDAQISLHPSHIHACNGMNRGSENCCRSRSGSCSPEIYKRPRTENMQNEGTSTAYSAFTCNPGGPKTVQAAQNTSKAFTFADAKRLMAYEKSRAFQRMFGMPPSSSQAPSRLPEPAFKS